jgi:hypothetical protein
MPIAPQAIRPEAVTGKGCPSRAFLNIPRTGGHLDVRDAQKRFCYSSGDFHAFEFPGFAVPQDFVERFQDSLALAEAQTVPA